MRNITVGACKMQKGQICAQEGKGKKLVLKKCNG